MSDIVNSDVHQYVITYSTVTKNILTHDETIYVNHSLYSMLPLKPLHYTKHKV